jgi:hypothetical protein
VAALWAAAPGSAGGHKARPYVMHATFTVRPASLHGFTMERQIETTLLDVLGHP